MNNIQKERKSYLSILIIFLIVACLGVLTYRYCKKAKKEETKKQEIEQTHIVETNSSMLPTVTRKHETIEKQASESTEKSKQQGTKKQVEEEQPLTKHRRK